MEDPRIISALFIFLKMAYYNVLINMQSVLSAVFDGKITPEEGAKKAQDDFEALVASE